MTNAEIALLVLFLHAGLAATWDVAQRRIPNWLIVSGLVFGLAFQTQAGGFVSLGHGVLGALLALAALIGPFALRWMGGGDVKIAMVCGAFLGWRGAVHVILLGTAIHGILGLGVLFKARLARTMGWASPDLRRLPHAVGFAAAVVLHGSGLGRFF